MGKIRVTLFNPSTWKIADGKDTSLYGLVVKEDRLVEAETLFRAGATETHSGPIRIDYLMENEDDVAGLIVYLQQLMGQLPTSPKQERKTKTKDNMPLEKDAVETLVEEAFEKCKTQNELIEYLRGLNFVFFTHENLKDITEKNGWSFKLKTSLNTYRVDDKGKKHPTKGIKRFHTDYQWMARLLKQAKNPINDKIDPQIFFGIKVIGDLIDKVQVYISGSYDKTKRLEWDETKVNFKKPEKFYKFPEPMTYKERSNWRAEDRKVHNDPNYVPSKFYERWKEYITILKPLKVKKK